jgi:hypothetical protein
MNELISNLFVLIPLAFLIAIRILQARAQRKAGVQAKQTPVPKRSLPGEGVVPRMGKGFRERRPLYSMAQEVATEFKKGEFVEGVQEETPYVPPRMIPDEESPTSEKERSEKITKLSPWKQAVVLREILDPPKGW